MTGCNADHLGRITQRYGLRMGSDAHPTAHRQMNHLTITLLVLGELFASVNDQMLEDALAVVLSEWFV